MVANLHLVHGAKSLYTCFSYMYVQQFHDFVHFWQRMNLYTIQEPSHLGKISLVAMWNLNNIGSNNYRIQVYKEPLILWYPPSINVLAP